MLAAFWIVMRHNERKGNTQHLIPDTDAICHSSELFERPLFKFQSFKPRFRFHGIPSFHRSGGFVRQWRTGSRVYSTLNTFGLRQASSPALRHSEQRGSLARWGFYGCTTGPTSSRYLSSISFAFESCFFSLPRAPLIIATRGAPMGLTYSPVHPLHGPTSCSYVTLFLSDHPPYAPYPYPGQSQDPTQFDRGDVSFILVSSALCVETYSEMILPLISPSQRALHGPRSRIPLLGSSTTKECALPRLGCHLFKRRHYLHLVPLGLFLGLFPHSHKRLHRKPPQCRP